MPFAVIARFTAKEGAEAALRDVFARLVAPTRAEAGCLHYELVQSQSDARLFTFFEKWDSEAAFAAHGQTAHVRRGREERTELIDGPADVSRWDVVPEG